MQYLNDIGEELKSQISSSSLDDTNCKDLDSYSEALDSLND